MERYFSRILLPLSMMFFVLAGCSDSASEDLNEVPDANRLTTGVSGKDLLTSEKFDRIVFDIAYVEGHEPSVESIQNFISFVDERCYKPGGIDYSLSSIPDPGKESFDISAIVELEEIHRVRYNEGNTIAVFVLVLNGASVRDSGNSVVLGTAYRNTSFVIFEETIERFSTQFISNDKTVLETTVLDHEFSHLLGLVNLGAEPQSDHEDPENLNHCEVADCLMNYQTDAGIDMSQLDLGQAVPDLDDQCLADLRALGGK